MRSFERDGSLVIRIQRLLSESQSEYTTRTYAAHIRYGYALEGKSVYLRPTLDAGYLSIERDGFTEQDSGATNLIVDNATDDLVTLQPALEIGGEVSLPSGARMRGWVRGGVTKLLSGEDVSVTARFASVPEDVAPMTLGQSLDTTSTDLAVGLDVLTQSGFTMRLTFSQSESDHTETQMGSLKVSGAF